MKNIKTFCQNIDYVIELTKMKEKIFDGKKKSLEIFHYLEKNKDNIEIYYNNSFSKDNHDYYNDQLITISIYDAEKFPIFLQNIDIDETISICTARENYLEITRDHGAIQISLGKLLQGGNFENIHGIPVYHEYNTPPLYDE